MAAKNKSYEVDDRTAVNPGRRDVYTPAAMLAATSIVGERVENPQGEKLGHIENLMINLDSGAIDYVVLEFGAFLGVGGKLFAIPWTELKLHQEKRIFILDRDKEYLKESPGFDKDHWPETNDHSYFENVKLYYGSYVPPFP